MDRYVAASEHIIKQLTEELSEKLYYHNITHILDVLNAVEEIAARENVEGIDLELLKIAALYHDSGFLVNNHDHENLSCEIARKQLAEFGYEPFEIETVCELILATKIPQQPKTHLQQIICDADLDYLGRDDFYQIGNKIFLELKARGQINNEHEWNVLQVRFLEAHHYFTATSIKLRKPVKEKHLNKIKSLITLIS